MCCETATPLYQIAEMQTGAAEKAERRAPGRVKTRMNRRGFPLTDELLRATNAAYDRAHALTMCLHYLSSKSGVGRPARVPGATTDGKNQDDLIACLRPPLG